MASSPQSKSAPPSSGGAPSGLVPEDRPSLHWIHWLAITLSLTMTLIAYLFTQNQVDQRQQRKFDREVERFSHLLQERMQKYEDALWGGVGAFRAKGGPLSPQDFKEFASTLRVNEKYPGINGIGYIAAILRKDKASYEVEQQAAGRPSFHIHPDVNEELLLPIQYIEPLEPNRQAVGLDISMEQMRRQAALRSRDTGQAQITGPIILVQDAGRTPGFLFYAPLYSGHPKSEEQRRAQFRGLLYAPFVVSRLLDGVLDPKARHLALRISDGDQVIYDELTENNPLRESSPQFAHKAALPLYGRTWQLELESTKNFRDASSLSQPLLILLLGLIIDGLLVGLFFGLARRSQMAMRYADSVTEQLRRERDLLESTTSRIVERTEALEKANAELEQFAYVASHDLRNPLQVISSYVDVLLENSEKNLSEEQKTHLGRIAHATEEIAHLVNDVLAISRVRTRGKPRVAVESRVLLENAIARVDGLTQIGADVSYGELPRIYADASQLEQVFVELLANALSFRCPDRPLSISVHAKQNGALWQFSVRDNGLGFDPRFTDRVFQMFQRLNNSGGATSTGIGLSLVKKIVERHGGTVWAETEVNRGTTIHFTVGPLGEVSSYPLLAHGHRTQASAVLR